MIGQWCGVDLRDGATQDTGGTLMSALQQASAGNQPSSDRARQRLARLAEPIGMVLLAVAVLVLAGAIVCALLGSFVIWLIVFWVLAAEVVAADLIRRAVVRLRPPVGALGRDVIPAGQ
jgi:hypothetical protein